MLRQLYMLADTKARPTSHYLSKTLALHAKVGSRALQQDSVNSAAAGPECGLLSLSSEYLDTSVPRLTDGFCTAMNLSSGHCHVSGGVLLWFNVTGGHHRQVADSHPLCRHSTSVALSVQHTTTAVFQTVCTRPSRMLNDQTHPGLIPIHSMQVQPKAGMSMQQ